MTDSDSMQPIVLDAFERHDAFEKRDPDSRQATFEKRDQDIRQDGFDREDGFTLTTTVFDAAATATADSEDDSYRFRIRIELPTLDAAVANETVASVVEEDWQATFERRLADVFTVADTDTHDELAVGRERSSLIVRLEYTARSPTSGVGDAKALVEYVEGTYAQGLIPGYTYRGPAGELRANAHDRAQSAVERPDDANR